MQFRSPEALPNRKTVSSRIKDRLNRGLCDHLADPDMAITQAYSEVLSAIDNAKFPGLDSLKLVVIDILTTKKN